MPHLFAQVIVFSFSVSLSLSLSESLFLSNQDKYEQENIQNRLVKKSYKLREDSSDCADAHADLTLRGTHTCATFDLSCSRSYLRFVLRAQDTLEY